MLKTGSGGVVGIYVETFVRVGLDTLWRHTQDPALHARWDARFTRIDGLTGNGGQRRFSYVTRLFPGIVIGGTGEAVGERHRADGLVTSALRFASDDRRSLIAHGGGYWRYVPAAGGVRFLTGYDYVPRWGHLGRLADRLFRPVFGWATAWSFDRLRLWLDRGVPPRAGLALGLAELALRLTAAVLAQVFGGFVVLAVVGALAACVPPSPWTPAARRCLRRPPDRLARTVPTTLTALEQP
jgi:hypothetical protein